MRMFYVLKCFVRHVRLKPKSFTVCRHPGSRSSSLIHVKIGLQPQVVTLYENVAWPPHRFTISIDTYKLRRELTFRRTHQAMNAGTDKQHCPSM